MLKAIQLFGGSSGFVSNLCKPHGSCGLSFISISSKPFSSSSSSSRRLRTTTALRCFREFRRSDTRCESDPDDASSSFYFPSSSSASAVVQSAKYVRNVKFCQWCGGATEHGIPDGEEKLRAICTVCGKIAYQNPKMTKVFGLKGKLLNGEYACPMVECCRRFHEDKEKYSGSQRSLPTKVVGCLIEHDSKVLLCKRKIEPSYGLWTLPAGYLEIGESAAEGAVRETWEEANAEVEVLSPFAQLDIPLIGQTYIIFLAKFKKPHFSPGPESSECQLFALDDIPFDSLAFSSMLVTLNLYMEDVKSGRVNFHYGTINKRPGTSPSEIRAYTLDYHLQS